MAQQTITISRQILEEMIDLKVFQCETNLKNELAELIKPNNAKALKAQEMANKVQLKQYRLEDKVDPFIKMVSAKITNDKKVDVIEQVLKEVEKDIREMTDRLGQYEEKMSN